MTKYLRFLCKFTSGSGETPTGNFSDVFLSYDNVEQKDACKRNLCYIYSFVWFWNIVDHWFKQEKRGKGGGGVNFTVKWMLCFDSLKRKIKIVATKA